jgi:hypothetical protein
MSPEWYSLLITEALCKRISELEEQWFTSGSWWFFDSTMASFARWCERMCICASRSRGHQLVPFIPSLSLGIIKIRFLHHGSHKDRRVLTYSPRGTDYPTLVQLQQDRSPKATRQTRTYLLITLFPEAHN